MKKYTIIFFLSTVLFFAGSVEGRCNNGGATKDTSVWFNEKLSTFKATTTAELVATGNQQVPFWMRSNHYGSIPTYGLSVSFLSDLHKDYSSAKDKLFDWGMGADLRANLGNNTKLIPIEAYLKGRCGMFELKIGRSKDHSGLIDQNLSSGSFVLSGNALGVPKIEIGVPDFWTIPKIGQLLAFKGNMAHGWMGDSEILWTGFSGQRLPTYFYHFEVYGRLGAPDWKIRFYGGINHDAIWGHDDDIFGDEYNLNNNLQAFWYVVLGKNLNTENISKIGNHIGSLDAGFLCETDNLDIFCYHQFFYDKGALYHFANISDGLSNVTITNKNYKNGRSKKWDWEKLLFEIFFSKNQAGNLNAKATASGAEFYYNHYVYAEGYSYKGLCLGNPFITVATDARSNLPCDPNNYFVNNRVLVFHLASCGTLKKWNYAVKISFSRNWGEYKTDKNGYWFMYRYIKQTNEYGIFAPVNQFSCLFEACRPIKNNCSFGISLVADKGKLLYDSVGSCIKITKFW